MERFEEMKKTSYLLSFGIMFALLGCGTAVATKETTDPASSMKVTIMTPGDWTRN